MHKNIMLIWIDCLNISYRLLNQLFQYIQLHIDQQKINLRYHFRKFTRSVNNHYHSGNSLAKCIGVTNKIYRYKKVRTCGDNKYPYNQ